MPNGKAAGQRCLQLSADNLCNIFGQPERPAVCSAFEARPRGVRKQQRRGHPADWLVGANDGGVMCSNERNFNNKE
ncbi:UNVERIFIED_ORG: hypothetical protein OKW15_000703 [Pseudomonas reinekei]|nr:hypothetical protein [Pseudomonas reinekei]